MLALRRVRRFSLIAIKNEKVSDFIWSCKSLETSPISETDFLPEANWREGLTAKNRRLFLTLAQVALSLKSARR